MKTTRRHFLSQVAATGALPWWAPLAAGCVAGGGAAAGTAAGTADAAKRSSFPHEEAIPYADAAGSWWKGNTHTHTFRSDGRALPEEAYALYRRAGYNFLVLTDHNTDLEDAKASVSIDARAVARYEKTFPGRRFDAVKDAAGKTRYRIRTYEELAKMFDEPGRFLCLSGNEVSGGWFGDNMHCNLINVRKGCSWNGKFEDYHQAIDRMFAIRDEIAGTREDVLFTMNHPQWWWYEILPDYLAHGAGTGFRFFEICNWESGPAVAPPPKAWTMDKFWDVVNAKRAAAGLPLVYGVGSDDIHSYETMYAGTSKHAWNMVRAPELTIPGLMKAFWRGDFYTSTGVTFKEVAFDPSSGEMRVEIDPKPGEEYVIQFIGTKRGFDPKPVETTFVKPPEKVLKGMRQWKRKLWEERKSRKIDVFSDSIGATFAKTEGTKASYRMEADDLYVRVKAFVKNDKGLENLNPPQVPVAWTQPVTRKGN